MRALCEENFKGVFDALHCTFRVALVALYRAMRLRFGNGFESYDANGLRNVKNSDLAKHRPVFLPPLLLVDSKELILKVPKRRQFHAAIRVPKEHWGEGRYRGETFAMWNR